MAVLVVGAAGGVGSILVQLLLGLTKVTVVGTASRPASVQWLKELGVHHVIDHRAPLFEGLREIGVPQVDFVASLNNTQDHLSEIVKSLVPQGHLGMIDDPKSFDVSLLKFKSIALHMELMYTRSMFKTPDMIEQHNLLNEVSRMIDQKRIKTTVAHRMGTITAKNLLKAHEMLEARKAHGKIVLEGFD
eukprot:gnl/Dysnectes_brevis/10180_a19800_77.p3 GENE.gnl/Dysnectes_brevis/10180_a19800_77~~gnl/Dysnectes_brevis/10180_a19800_77.p3  ORF type:complete len:189 (+),score=70.45 gnl/Dysnectes_brevis/10180_a19800_77:640-1206(+)